MSIIVVIAMSFNYYFYLELLQFYNFVVIFLLTNINVKLMQTLYEAIPKSS